MRIIVDASIWVEAMDPASPVAALATRLRERLASASLVAPALLVWELGNYGARLLEAVPGETPTGVSASVHGFVEDVALDVPGLSRTARVLELAATHSLTFYDASYLELASRDADSLLITADGPLGAAALEELGKDRVLDLEGAAARFAA